MAFVADGSYTYNGQEAAELTIRPAVERPALSDIFAITEGLKGTQYVSFLERLGLVTIVDPGCGQGATTFGTKKSNKKWAPVDLKAWHKECWTNIRGTAEEWGLKPGNDKPDLTDTEYGVLMVELLSSAIGNDLVRMAHFADKSLVSTKLTGSVTLPDGRTLNAAALLPFFKTFNGLWRNVELGVAATLTKYVEIEANDTSGDQILDPNDVPGILQQMFSAQDPRLAGQATANKQLLVTNSFFDAWTIYRESKNLDLAYVAQADGVARPTFRGVPFVVVNEWDEYINQFFKPASLSGKVDRPHRALLTVKGNLQLRFDGNPVDSNGKGDLRVFYDEMSETWNAKQLYAGDQQIADDALVVAAY
ncbi:hypothetical protein GCM10028807_32700 [Spirosoma daeguense]